MTLSYCASTSLCEKSGPIGNSGFAISRLSYYYATVAWASSLHHEYAPLQPLSPRCRLGRLSKTYSILKKAGRVICRASVLFLRLKGKFLLLQRHFPLLTQRVGGRTGTKQPRLPYPLETSLSSKQNMGAGEG